MCQTPLGPGRPGEPEGPGGSGRPGRPGGPGRLGGPGVPQGPPAVAPVAAPAAGNANDRVMGNLPQVFDGERKNA